MKILTLKKNNIICACGCNKPLSKGNLVNKMNGKYYKLYCGKLYRLLVESNKRIKGWCNGSMQNMQS